MQIIKDYFKLIKFEHTVFALPFALSGMLLATPEGLPKLITVIWVILAMIGGRTGTMALNRVIDAEIDKRNARTANREIPSGKIKKTSAVLLAMFSFALMIFAVLHLPEICIKLLPLAIFILLIYSYTKRFTYLSHFILGGALGAAASGGWLAVSGQMSLPVAFWGLAITFWVAGFDVIYAILDIDFDRENKLLSIPAWLGVNNALLLSKVFHLITVLLLFLTYLSGKLDLWFLSATTFVSLMLIYEHYILRGGNLERINEAFFNVNGYVSIGFFIIILLGKLI